jgi:SAM-dependent methyltransferase
MWFAAEIKSELRRLASTGAGGVILDLGSGAGHGVLELARSGHRVVGVEPSRVMVHEAKARAARAGLSADLVRARGEALPLATATVGTCHVDRVLQHVADPVVVLAEIHRVLVPGGRVVIWEPDWGTLGVDVGDGEGNEALARCLAGYGPVQRRVGLRLRGLLVRAGFVDVDCRQIPRGITNLADTTLRLEPSVARAVRNGLFSQPQAEHLRQLIVQAQEDGTFWASFNRYLAVAVRPSRLLREGPGVIQAGRLTGC